jgi:DNA repair protein RadA/Sms
VAEIGVPTIRTTAATSVVRPALRIGQVDVEHATARSTGVSELDRVLGGGLVPGAVVLVAGEPGIGKSTLLLDVAARAARGGQSVLYVSGEESAAQVRMRAERIEAMAATLFLAAETDLATVLGQVEAVQPDLVIVDSVQTIASAQVEGAAGNVSQVREVAASLIQAAKSRGVAVLLVGHVTKDGSIAGPRTLEHLVDVVVQFEGDRHSRLRLVRAVKNRYGPTDEVGCFDLSDVGIVGLADPSGLFLSHRDVTVAGTCVTVTLEGRRPLVAEVQALIAPSTLPSPRRATHGLDASRVAMIMAVLERRARIPIGARDAYVSTVGGVRLAEPAADLAVALSVASSVVDSPLPPHAVAFGEVGLAGELRPVSGMPRRLAEAGRLGFRTAFTPRGVVGSGPIPDGVRVVEVPDVATAVVAALDVPARGSAPR